MSRVVGYTRSSFIKMAADTDLIQHGFVSPRLSTVSPFIFLFVSLHFRLTSIEIGLSEIFLLLSTLFLFFSFLFFFPPPRQKNLIGQCCGMISVIERSRIYSTFLLSRYKEKKFAFKLDVDTLNEWGGKGEGIRYSLLGTEGVFE